MLIKRKQKKQANLILYIIDSCKTSIPTPKMYYIMYLADFIHYMETGRSITGLKYYKHTTYLFPVPLKLEQKLLKGNHFDPYFSSRTIDQSFNYCDQVYYNNAKCRECEELLAFNWFFIHKLTEPTIKCFSKRELKIINKVIEIVEKYNPNHHWYNDNCVCYSYVYSQFFHKIDPFLDTVASPEHNFTIIDYKLVLDNLPQEQKESILETIKEHKEFVKNYSFIKKEKN